MTEIDFEQELYKAFGQVKDFTLGMQIAKRFYEMGKQHQEPVSEDLEEAARKYADIRISNYETAFYAFMFGAKWQKRKDSISSKDLEELINTLSKRYPEVSFAKLSRIAVRVAKWQEQQDQSTIELAEDHAMLAGMEKMKEEMMANAIEGKVLANGMGNPILHLWDKGRHLIDKKVKVIVIKQD